jgi:putative FmdB family regulatory protein
MPIYEYICPVCNKEFEQLSRKISDSKVSCPECDTPSLKKISKTKVGNSEAFRKKWHPEECNAEKDIKHWQKKHNQNFWDV